MNIWPFTVQQAPQQPEDEAQWEGEIVEPVWLGGILNCSNKAPTKGCSTCLQTKPRTEFFKDSSRSDGLLNRCKVCDSMARKLTRPKATVGQRS